LENAKEAIEECEREYQLDQENITRQEQEEEIFKREKFPERFTVRKLFG